MKLCQGVLESVLTYAPSSKPAEDFNALIQEVIQEFGSEVLVQQDAQYLQPGVVAAADRVNGLPYLGNAQKTENFRRHGDDEAVGHHIGVHNGGDILSAVIAITNQKGGVGKTTTSCALLAGLQQMGNRVLGIDLDPQGSLGFCLGLDIDNCATIYDVNQQRRQQKSYQQPL